MAKQTDLKWQNVDIDSFPRPLAKAWTDFRAAQQVANSKRSAFEAAATQYLTKAQAIPPGQEPVYSYKFGKLGIAFRNATGAAKSGTKEAFKF